MTRSRSGRPRATSGVRWRWRCARTPPSCCRNWPSAASFPTSSPIRPFPIRSKGYVPAELSLEEARAMRTQRSGEADRAGTEIRRHACSRDAGLHGSRRDRVRIRQQSAGRGKGRRRRRRVSDALLCRSLYPPAVLPGDRAVPLDRGLRQSAGHLHHRRHDPARHSRPTIRFPPGSRRRASMSNSPACRRASAGSAMASAAVWRCWSTKPWPAARFPRRSPSPAIISIPVRRRCRIARPKT